MGGEKRKHQDQGGGAASGKRVKKRNFYSEASKGRSNNGEIRGPGIWITCERRKEAKSVTEAYDLLNEIADKLYPETISDTLTLPDGDGSLKDDDESIEAQIARELEGLKPNSPNRRKTRFTSIKTNTECLVWISCLPPCDPVVLVTGIVADLQGGGPPRSRYLQRMTPVSATTHADISSFRIMVYKVLQPIFAPYDYTGNQRDIDPAISYRVEPFLRNHTATLNREIVTQIVGDIVRDLTNPLFQFPEPPHMPKSIISRETPIVKAKEASEEPSATVELPEADPPATEDSKDVMQLSAETVSSDLKGLEASTETDATPPRTETAAARPPLAHIRRRTYVDLKCPSHTILITALKGVCGISVVEGYDKGRKFNIQSLSQREAAASEQREVEVESTETK